MSKIIITNESGVKDDKALDMVKKVIARGRISNDGKQYCYVTVFHNGLAVYSKLNKCSDSFFIWRSE